MVIGDFDADNATSSALAVSALRVMCARHVEFWVPNRFEFGYGLTPGIVSVAQQWKPKLIVTVDNGIASINEVDAANKAEMSEQALFALTQLNSRQTSHGHELPVALCLVDNGWDKGVIGILAWRLKERYHRRVIIFAVVNDELKGSARFIPGLNIHDVLAVFAIPRD